MIDKLASYLFVEFIQHKVFFECWDAKQFGKNVFKIAKTIECICNTYVAKLLHYEHDMD